MSRLFNFVAVAVVLLCGISRSQTQQTPEDLLRAATELAGRADYSHAIPLLQRFLADSPRNGDANYLLGQAFLQTGRPGDAVDPLRVAIAMNPRNEAAEGYLGDAEMELKNNAAAAEVFEAAVTNFRSSEKPLVWWTDFSLQRFRDLEFSLRASSRGRAELLMTAARAAGSDPKTKQSLLNQAIALNSNAQGAWGELGVTQFELGLLPDARSSLKKALESQPKATSTVELLCLIDASSGDFHAAEAKLLEIGNRSRAELYRLVTAWPASLLPAADGDDAAWDCVRNHSMNCLIALVPQHQLAISDQELFDEGRWDTLIAMPPPLPDETQQWYWRGIAFAESDDCPHAIPDLERGLNSGAESAAAHLASCYRSEAVAAADRLKAEGKDASVHKIRGDILLSIRLEPAQAVAEYKAALQLKPGDPELLEKLAEAYFSQGEMRQARESAETALRTNPNRSQLLRLLIRIDMSERDYPEALARLAPLLATEPGDAWAQVQKAIADCQTGHPAEGTLELKTALDAGYPDSKGSLHALLAAQLRKLGREDEAQRAAEAAIKLSDSYQRQAQQAPESQP